MNDDSDTICLWDDILGHVCMLAIESYVKNKDGKTREEKPRQGKRTEDKGSEGKGKERRMKGRVWKERCIDTFMQLKRDIIIIERKRGTLINPAKHTYIHTYVRTYIRIVKLLSVKHYSRHRN